MINIIIRCSIHRGDQRWAIYLWRRGTSNCILTRSATFGSLILSLRGELRNSKINKLTSRGLKKGERRSKTSWKEISIGKIEGYLINWTQLTTDPKKILNKNCQKSISTATITTKKCKIVSDQTTWVSWTGWFIKVAWCLLFNKWRKTSNKTRDMEIW